MDRFDLHVELSHLAAADISNASVSNTENESDRVRKDVSAAQAIQYDRQGKLNGELSKQELNTFAPLSSEQHKWLANVCEKRQWSLRAWDRIHRVARTISDLNASSAITDSALKEATLFRRSELSIGR